MNKRMNLRIQVTAIYKKDRHGSQATRKRYYQAACYACDYIAGTCNLQKFSNFQPKHFREVAEYWKTTKELNTVYTELTGLRKYCEYAGCKYKMPENKELNLPKREPTKYNRAWLPHEIQKAKELAETMGRFDVRDAIEVGEKLGASDYRSLSVQGRRCEIRTRLGRFGNQGVRAVRYGLSRLKLKNRRSFCNACITNPKQRGWWTAILFWARQSNTVRVWKRSLSKTGYTIIAKSLQIPNREQTIKRGKKPRVKNIVFHGLRHTYTQERNKRLQGDPRRRQKLSEGLGHHRLSVTNIYKE